MIAMGEEPELKSPKVPWAFLVTLALVVAAAIYCEDHPDSFLARLLKSSRPKNSPQPSPR